LGVAYIHGMWLGLAALQTAAAVSWAGTVWLA
jgi:hypothetical protein